MILFLDTSALVKLFVEEEFSDDIRRLADNSPLVIISQIAWVEVCAALGLKRRTGQISDAQVGASIKLLRKEWSRFNKLNIDPALITKAGDFALEFNLRAYDSVQLASAAQVSAAVSKDLMFCCFDKRLNVAAQALNLAVPDFGIRKL